MPDDQLIIREPKIPLLNRIAVSLILTFFLGIFIYIFNIDVLDLFTSGNVLKFIFFLFFFIILLLSFTPLIARHYIHLDFKTLKIKHSYEIGLFKYHERWQDLVELEYISVFKVGESYQINLWYETTKILNLLVTEDYKNAMEKGAYLSKQLHIDLLDATIRNDFKWVDKSMFKETH